MKSNFKTIFILLIFLCLQYRSFSQSAGFGNLFNSGSTLQNDLPKQPTLIDSDSMDMDTKKNITIFIGNVVVDSQKLHITCERMVMYMEVVKINGVEKKKLREIHCFKNRSGKQDVDSSTDKRVVIIRKLPKAEVKANGEQRAISGKAVYNVVSGEIVLTDKPVMVQGEHEIKGSKIIIWRDSDKMHVDNCHIRYVEQDTSKKNKIKK